MKFFESLVHKVTMYNSESIQIMCFSFANPYPVQKICFVNSFLLLCSEDLFCGFDLGTCFQITHFVDWFRIFFSKITRFVSIQKDSFTNPTTLLIILLF
jgi:hypothetical protein